MERTETLLMVADTEHDANMLYAVRMFVPDPFIYLRVHGREHVVMNDLEIDRARNEAAHCRVLSLGDYQKKLRQSGSRTGFAEVIRTLLREKRVNSVLVPNNFPLGLAVDLQQLGIRVKPRSGAFFEERECKSPAEVKKISAALRMAEVGMAEGIRVLKAAKIVIIVGCFTAARR